MCLAPALHYSESREAYVLPLIGRHVGPVLRPERRKLSADLHSGPERRRTIRADRRAAVRAARLLRGLETQLRQRGRGGSRA